MGRSHSVEAIILKTYDVGEADRFCILFTREQGRIAARASGARRVTSRLGGALLPFRRITVELKEHSSGWFIGGAQTQEHSKHGSGLHSFAMLEEGIEILLKLVTDEGALPEVYEATASFIDACHEGIPHANLGYSFALLHLLGLLPDDAELTAMASLGSHEYAYLQQARAALFSPSHAECDHQRLLTLRSLLLEPHLNAPLKAPDIAAMMA